MKTTKLIIAASLGLIIPLMSMGQSTLGPGATTPTGLPATMGSLAGNPNSPHNFANQSWNIYQNVGLGGQVCQPCHTPHNAQGSTTLGAPLWNHQMTGAAYTMYSSINTAAGTMGVVAPDGTSKLCLSCHDGTVALGAFGTQTLLSGGPTMTTFAPGAAFGTDLSNDHPISVDYVAVKAAGWGSLQATTYVYATSYDAVAGSYVWGASTKTTQGKLDANNKVQCTSCHGAHGNSIGYQLSMNNQGSLLCLVCHKK